MSAAERTSRPPLRRTLFALLRQVEILGGSGLVNVQIGGLEAGQLMIASGRVCYAGSPHAHTPIGAILTQVDPAFERELHDSVAAARAQGRRLCETLLEHGSLPLPQLREGLRRQTTEALLGMAGAVPSDEVTLRVLPARDDYDARLTFAPFEIFLAVSAALDAAPPDLASAVFHEYADFADAALLLVRAGGPGGLPLPVAAHGFEQASIEHMAQIARAASQACCPPASTAAGLEPRLVAFRSHDLLWVGVTGSQRLALVRTGAEASAGQVLGFAASLLRRPR